KATDAMALRSQTMARPNARREIASLALALPEPFAEATRRRTARKALSREVQQTMRLGLPILATGSVALATASLYYATFAVRSQWLGRTHWRGRTDTNTVALTFDDGPSPDTQRMLDVLGAHEAKATFFMVGREV